MPYDLEDLLVVGVASSALFDLAESDEVFRTKGEDEYRAYQEEHLDHELAPGVAYPFVKRLLSLNDLSPDDPLVEVIILSHNDPDTGRRVMRSVESHGLPITRAVFMQGRSPYAFMPAFNMCLFLSADADVVRTAVQQGLPAGQVMGSPADDADGDDLRIAFDFDGVLADDSSEKVMQAGGLDDFRQHEIKNIDTPIAPGLLHEFLAAINRIQDVEDAKYEQDNNYNRRVHVAIVTARNAPAHERAILSLKSRGVRVNDAFFLGGIDKGRIIKILRPHIFFDDQLTHVDSTLDHAPSVHVPFGVTNSPKPA